MICERMGWTYDELENTPEDFLVALYARLEVEEKHQEQQRKKMEQKMATMKRGTRKH